MVKKLDLSKFDSNKSETESESTQLKLTPSELKVLDDMSSNQDSIRESSSRSIRAQARNSDPNYQRFVAANLVLLTNGLMGLLLNAYIISCGSRSNLAVLLALPSALFVYEWQRLHGETLSRELRPIVNVASVLATFKDRDPLYQLYSDENAKIMSCCDGPGINSDLPRTAEEHSDEASSPPLEKSATSSHRQVERKQ
ncbi:hypothetical protein M3Y97_00270900 [Aphelenchoides bicaudatus]|nr:hypothetical protein M3Y97_00270900 [Aphelenchoides bicaudatus]